MSWRKLKSWKKSMTGKFLLNEKWHPFLLYLISLFILAFYVGPYMWRPNDFVFAFGGDPLVIYHNMVYHICHDTNFTHLGATNYPYGESIFMTDAQALFSTLLKFIQLYIADVCTYVPGIVHSIMFILFPFTSVFIFFIFRKLGVNPVFAFIFSLLIAFLSPQIMRMPIHFGLAYPFLIPMAIYWAISAYHSEKIQFKDFLYGVVIFLFFLNNPYMGLIAASVLISAGFITFISKKYKAGVTLFSFGFLPIIAGYVFVKLIDPFTDRIGLQWGFLHYHADLRGFLFPPRSLIHRFISTMTQPPTMEFESIMNIGLVAVCVLLIFLGKTTYAIVRKKSYRSFPWQKSFLAVVAGCFCVFLLGSIGALGGFVTEWIEEYLGALLMFKASGRLGWPLYYCLTIMVCILLYSWYTSNKEKRWVLPLMILTMVIWVGENHFYLKKIFVNIHHSNCFNSEEIASKVLSLQPELGDHQAIYLIPVVHVWNDKLMFPLDFTSHYTATMISSYSGIPLISGTLSRASLLQSITSVQLASHPVLQRQRWIDMDKDKPILLVHGNDHGSLSEGEKFLIDKAKPIGKVLHADIYSLDPADIVEPVKISGDEEGFIHKQYSEENLLYHSAPTGMCVNEIPQILWEGSLLPFIETDSLEISLWHYLDHKYHYVPHLEVNTYSIKIPFYSRSKRDFAGYWSRQSVVIPWSDSISISASCRYPAFFDHIQIKPHRKNTMFSINKEILWWNNYPVMQ